MLTRESAQELRTVLVILGLGVLLAVIVAILLARGLTRPVLALAGQARALAIRYGGPSGERQGRDEIDALAQAFRTLEDSLQDRDRRLAADLEEIHQIAADRERLNAELQELANDLATRVEARTRELQAAQQALLTSERLVTIGKTAAALAHELRNALNGLSIAADLLAQVAGDRGSPALRERVHREIGRLRALSESLLSFSGAPTLALTKDDLNELLRRVVANFHEDLLEFGIQIELDLDAGGKPLPINCDVAKVETALGNLLRNAIQATQQTQLQEGAAEAGRTAEPLWVSTRREDRKILVEIADRGPGLSEEALEHLFEPFFSTKRTGTGLGLVTAQRFIEAHGGTIRAGTRAGGGAVFRVELPDTLATNGDEAAPPAQEVSQWR
jgi:hypothetical protein